MNIYFIFCKRCWCGTVRQSYLVLRTYSQIYLCPVSLKWSKDSQMQNLLAIYNKLSLIRLGTQKIVQYFLIKGLIFIKVLWGRSINICILQTNTLGSGSLDNVPDVTPKVNGRARIRIPMDSSQATCHSAAWYSLFLRSFHGCQYPSTF